MYMENSPFDAATIKILAELQRNSSLSLNDLAERIGMSATPCWRRQKELEEKDVITRYVAIVDRTKVGLAQCCLLHISLTRHDSAVVATFESEMRLRPEVMECYEVTGSSDYMVKLVVQDMNAYHDFLHNVLLKLPGVSQVNTSVALREVKYETALPL